MVNTVEYSASVSAIHCVIPQKIALLFAVYSCVSLIQANENGVVCGSAVAAGSGEGVAVGSAVSAGLDVVACGVVACGTSTGAVTAQAVKQSNIVIARTSVSNCRLTFGMRLCSSFCFVTPK